MTKFWLDDYKILFKHFYSIFPKKNMNKVEILNAITRFSLISLILFIFISSDKKWFYLPITTIIICIILFLINKNDEKDENEISCRKPNINNPFMNTLATNDKVDMPSCKYNSEIVKESDEKYKFNLYQNMVDLFDNKHTKRQFYTMPTSTIPNKQNEFAEWLYKLDENCKYDGVDCLKYEDIRFH